MPPLALSTWSFGAVANGAAWPLLQGGGDALDAVVKGATAVEEDPAVDSVGVGGLPDAAGEVTLDAMVMTDPAQSGAVGCLAGYVHAAALARRVMEGTIHKLLVGTGAAAFAERQGFARANLLTPQARAAWERWRAENPEPRVGGKLGYVAPMNVEERYRQEAQGGSPAPARPLPGHDTVCVLAIDARGRLAGAVTTSGLGFKIPGRVGDSPTVGHGLYVEQGVGAAAATGNGELVMGVCGSFLGVELMRAGRSPADAIRGVLERVVDRYELHPDHQVGLIAVGAHGGWASGALREGFAHCVSDAQGTRTEKAQHVWSPTRGARR